jgi:AcrR family transcriptional regulator
MGSRERRTRERDETRQRILEAARDMFVRHGYEDTTAIYHHFKNKEALLTELCTADFRALASAFHQIGRAEDPLERLRRVGEAYVTFALEHPMQYQLLFMTRHPQGVDGGVIGGQAGEDAYGFLRETCAAAIATARLRPELDDPDELAQIAWSSLHGLIALQVVKQDGGVVEWREIRSTATRMHDVMLRGMLRDDAR